MNCTPIGAAPVPDPGSVLLVRPPDPFQGSALLSHTRPMNLAYLASSLRRAGFRVAIADYEALPYSEEHLATLLQRLSPGVVGLSATTPTIGSAALLAQAVKRLSGDTVTVIGGSHASALPRETLEEFPFFDYLVRGEGELTLAELCLRLQDGGADRDIRGIAYRSGGGVMVNPPRELVADLDSLPFPARDLLDYSPRAGHSSRGFSNALRSGELFTSRGCPVACSFCAIQATFGRSVRFRDPACIADELARMVREQQVNHVVIADDTFTLDAERAASICEILLNSGIRSWNCDTRVNTVTPELLRLMRRCGCEKVAFGVESGSPRLLGAMGKGITVEQVERAVCWAREAGIRHVEGNFIVGCDPSETREDLEQTRRLIQGLPWTFVSVSVVVPYPGTPLREKMLAAGLIEPGIPWEDYVIFGKKPRWRTANFSAEELLEYQRSFTRSFYLRPRYVLGQLAAIRSREELGYWTRAGFSYLKWYATGKM
ncbi:Radical SAM domain protein [Citrifermentans bremense]|uniref:Radical SAM domain protein n=1 Tax=Citrifermentans bremense TaxID=60035 RepID=A0A6S6LWZ4_9BACT|nr:radical SAM protein [Citrifermentans bremense]BCG46163.1 Radical SAM domain protein [Citrifermentans bremense]